MARSVVRGIIDYLIYRGRFGYEVLIERMEE